MRDKKRISRIMKVFKEIWELVPNWRFGQLLSNMIGEIMTKHTIADIFFPDDDKWEQWLIEYRDDLKGPMSEG